MKEFDNEIKKHIDESMSKIEDNSFTSKLVERHLLSRKEKESKSHFNFEALLFWIVSVLISVALLVLTVNNDIGFYEIQIKHCLVLISVALTGLVYKWLETIYSA
jgi:NADH:ubiquinone oxidoreductase subunit 3 (subunit A)